MLSPWVNMDMAFGDICCLMDWHSASMLQDSWMLSTGKGNMLIVTFISRCFIPCIHLQFPVPIPAPSIPWQPLGCHNWALGVLVSRDLSARWACNQLYSDTSEWGWFSGMSYLDDAEHSDKTCTYSPRNIRVYPFDIVIACSWHCYQV